jgi:hypothetical protein
MELSPNKKTTLSIVAISGLALLMAVRKRHENDSDREEFYTDLPDGRAIAVRYSEKAQTICTDLKTRAQEFVRILVKKLDNGEIMVQPVTAAGKQPGKSTEFEYTEEMLKECEEALPHIQELAAEPDNPLQTG